MGTKICTRCGIEKPYDELYKIRARRSGLQAVCKKCAAAYHAKTKDRIHARQAAYRAANKEKLAATNAAWRGANKEKLDAYRAANKRVSTGYAGIGPWA